MSGYMPTAAKSATAGKMLVPETLFCSSHMTSLPTTSIEEYIAGRSIFAKRADRGLLSLSSWEVPPGACTDLKRLWVRTIVNS